MAKVGGLSKAVQRMVRHSQGGDNKAIHAFLNRGAHTGGANSGGGSGDTFPVGSLTMGGEYLTMDDEVLVME